jgi:hypothetical protein
VFLVEYYYGSQINVRMILMEHEKHMGKMRNTYKILVGKRGVKRPIGRQKYR